MHGYILQMHDGYAAYIFKNLPPKQPNVEMRKQYLFGKHPHIVGSRNKILMTVDSSGNLQWLVLS